MIPTSKQYKLTQNDGLIIAEGSKRDMTSASKRTPGSRVWLTSAPVGANMRDVFPDCYDDHGYVPFTKRQAR